MSKSTESISPISYEKLIGIRTAAAIVLCAAAIIAAEAVPIEIGFLHRLVNILIWITCFVIVAVVQKVIDKKYPKWEEFHFRFNWTMLSIVLIACGGIVYCGEFFTGSMAAKFACWSPLFLVIAAINIRELHLARRYHLDRYRSPEELIQAHPELTKYITIKAA